MTSNTLKNITPVRSEKEFRQLYDAHWDILFRIAVKKTGSASDATDLVQDVFLHIWEDLPLLDFSGTDPRAYLVTCLYHRIFNHFRAKGLKEKHYQLFEAYLAGEGMVQEAGQTTMNEMEWQAINEVLRTGMEEMPVQMKQIFRMKNYENKSVQDIATELSLSPQTVKNQLSLAVKRLRSHASLHVSGPRLILLLLLLAE
jgi:RNA polymerase sigma-70 factor (family 1)